MKKIKVVGDIWSGKYQPALTGNRIVDTALLTQFCQKLATWLSDHRIDVPIQIEHEFKPVMAPAEVLYLIDANIIGTLTKDYLQSVHYLPVKHLDLLHADPTNTLQQLLAGWSHDLNIQKQS